MDPISSTIDWLGRRWSKLNKYYIASAVVLFSTYMLLRQHLIDELGLFLVGIFVLASITACKQQDEHKGFGILS